MTIQIKATLGKYDHTTRSVPIVASTTDPVNGEALTNWDLDRFAKNPVILWGHDPFSLPIGLAKDVIFKPGLGLEMTIFFGSAAANPFAEQVSQCVAEGLVRAVSVGYDVLDGVATLCEVSFVTIGADENAGTPLIDPDHPDNDEVIMSRVKAAASTLAKHRARANRMILAGGARTDAADLFEEGVRLDMADARKTARLDSLDGDLPAGFVGRMDATRLGKVTRTSIGGARIPARLSRTGVLAYRNGDGSIRRELRLEEEVFKADSLATLSDVPVIDIADHTKIHGPDTWRSVARGHVSNVRQDGSFIASELVIQDKATLDAIDSGERTEISCGYVCKLDMTPGNYNGESYDCVQRDIRYNHAALCPPNRGRAGPDVGLRLDAKNPWAMALHFDEEDQEMTKIKLDGKEYVVGSDEHIAKLEEMSERAVLKARMDAKTEAETKIADATAKVAELQVKLDKAEGERDAAKDAILKKIEDDKKKKDEEDAKAADEEKGKTKARKLRRRLERVFARFFGDDPDKKDEDKMDAHLDSLTDRDLMIAVMQKASPRFDAATIGEKNDDYVTARFDAAIEAVRESKSINGVNRALDREIPNLDSNDGTIASDDPVLVARAERDKRSAEAWKQKF